MASIRLQPNGRWRVYVSRKGHPKYTKVFKLKYDAEAWAREIEARIDGGATYELNVLRNTTVADILERFRLDVVPHRKGWRWDDNRCRAYQAVPWAKMSLDMPIDRAVSAWCEARLAGTLGSPKVSAATVYRELNFLSSVFTYAIKRLHIKIPDGNPISRVQRPQVRGDERSEIWTDQDLDLMLNHLGFDLAVRPTSVRSYLGWVLLLARHTGLRLGNVVGIRLANVDLERRCIHFPAAEMKNDQDYDCPLSNVAISLLRPLMAFREGQTKLIPSTAGSIGTMLRTEHRAAAAKHPQLAGLRTHDLRHTWTTEMVRKVPNQLTMLKITGRRTVKSLARYYNPPIEDLAKLLD